MSFLSINRVTVLVLESLLLTPLVSLAQPPGDVNVTVTNGAENPVAVSPAAYVEIQLIGFTSHTTNGNVEKELNSATGQILTGTAAMNWYCRAEFSSTARAATAEQALRYDDTQVFGANGTYPPEAWVKYPSIATIYTYPDPFNDGKTLTEVVPVQSDALPQLAFSAPKSVALTMGCNDYTSSASNWRGVVVTPSGTIRYAKCNSEKPIACAAPVSVQL